MGGLRQGSRPWNLGRLAIPGPRGPPGGHKQQPDQRNGRYNRHIHLHGKQRRSEKSLTLAAEEFIRRFLQHVLPKGFHKIRYYGQWGTANRKKAENIQLTMLLTDPQPPVPGKDETPSRNHPLEGRKYPQCGQGLLVWIGVINPLRVRAP